MSNTPDKRADAGLAPRCGRRRARMLCMGAQPHFCSVADEDEDKPGLEPHGDPVDGAASVRAEKEMVASTLPTSMATVTSTDPNRARAIPTEQMSTYFQVASRGQGRSMGNK